MVEKTRAGQLSPMNVVRLHLELKSDYSRCVSHVTLSPKPFFPERRDLHETHNTNDTVTSILRRDLDPNGCALTGSPCPKSNSNTASGAYTGIPFDHGGQRQA